MYTYGIGKQSLLRISTLNIVELTIKKINFVKFLKSICVQGSFMVQVNFDQPIRMLFLWSVSSGALKISVE